jgi:hypothetical protein
MPKQTKQQKELSLIHFVADFTIMQEKFKDSTIGMVRIPDFEENGWWYCNIWRDVWPDGFIEYYMERYSKNIFDREICKTKRDQRDAIHEWAFIYPLNNVDQQLGGVIMGDWRVQGFSRKKGL